MGVLARQADDVQTWQGLQVPDRFHGLPGSEEHPDTVGKQPSCHEAEGDRGLLVQPLRVVNHAQHRPVLRGVREEGENRQADQEGIRRRLAHQAEGDAQRPPLRHGQPVHPVKQREEQLVDAGEAQALLGLDGRRPEDLQVGGAMDGVVQQRRLPDPGLPAQDQHSAHPSAHAVQQLVQRLLLGMAVDEPHPLIVVQSCPLCGGSLARRVTGTPVTGRRIRPQGCRLPGSCEAC